MSKIKIVFYLVLVFIVYKGFVAFKNFEISVDDRVAQIEEFSEFEKEGQAIGLMMYLGDEEDLQLVEHLLVKSRSKCFEMKQIAEESSNAYYECAKIKAIVKEGKILRVLEELKVL